MKTQMKTRLIAFGRLHLIGGWWQGADGDERCLGAKAGEVFENDVLIFIVTAVTS